MFSLYQLAKFLHISGAILLFVGMGLAVATLMKLRAARTTEEVRFLSPFAAYTTQLMPVATLLVILPGLYMLHATWGWFAPWADVAFAGAVLMSVLGPAVSGKRMDQIIKMSAGGHDGPIPSDLAALLNDAALAASLSLAVFLAAATVLLMTFKPGWTVSVAIAVASSVLGVIVGIKVWRPNRAASSAAVPSP